MVRALLTDNALHWIDEYHVDGLRLDATHSLYDSRRRHFVAELTEAVHDAATPRPLVYAEDHRNLATMLEPCEAAGWDLDGVWADDFHHVIRRMLAGDRHGYYVDYQGTAGELAETLRQGWLFTGQRSTHEGAPRGTDPSSIPLRKSVVCVQNHDQIGNRALGDRLHHVVDAASWRAAVTVLLAAPMTPLLFMGQEWATSAPFQFFTDFEPELGRKVVEGRRREFKAFPEFATEEGSRRVPDPQAEATFAASQLRWSEAADGEHARSLALHRALLQLRQAHPSLHASDAGTCSAEALDDDTVAMRRCGGAASGAIVVARLRGAGRVHVRGLHDAGGRLLDTEDPRFAADPRSPRIDTSAETITFERPGALILASART
jgi:maltooligosyltrehalose trehalohydrolase